TDRLLSSRRFDGYEFSLLECHVCAGIFLRHADFEILEADALRREAPYTGPGSAGAKPIANSASFTYRNCPDCITIMNRVQFGQTSGIILDICGKDGVWFDALELGAVL